MYQDPRYGVAVLVLVAMSALGGVILSVIMIDALIKSVEKGSYLSGEFVFYFFLVIWIVFISFSGVRFILSARKTIKEIGIKGNAWRLVTFWGECVFRTDEQVLVHSIPSFSKWDRFYNITSLLSREKNNLEIIDKLTGKRYSANGEYFDENLIRLGSPNNQP